MRAILWIVMLASGLRASAQRADASNLTADWAGLVAHPAQVETLLWANNLGGWSVEDGFTIDPVPALFIPRVLPQFAKLRTIRILGKIPISHIRALIERVAPHAPKLRNVEISLFMSETDADSLHWEAVLDVLAHNKQLRKLALGGKLRFFPVGLSKLQDLTDLSAHVELFSPDWAGHLARLEQLPKLRSLQLEHIDFAHLPKSFGALAERLKVLKLYGISTQKQSDFPQALRQCRELRELMVSTARFSEIPAWISELKNLNNLFISHIQTQHRTNFLRGVTRLKWLYISQSECTPEILDEIGRMKSLEQLFLTYIGGAEMGAVWRISSLRELMLVDCRVDSVPARLGHLKKLRYLYLQPHQNSRLPAEYPSESLAALGNLDALEELHLIGCGLRSIPASLYRLQRLKTLDLSRNPLTSAPERPAGSWPALQTLLLPIQHQDPAPAPRPTPTPIAPRLRETAFRTLLQN